MIDYAPARKEIRAAKSCIDSMHASKDHDEFEQHWRNLLTHLEKAYNKLLCATKPVKGKFSSHFCGRMKDRKSDQVVVYLLQARNTDQHSTADIAQPSPAHTLLTAKPGGRGHIKAIQMNENGIIIDYEGTPLNVAFHPATTKAITVRNQGKDYHPPRQHLGEILRDNHPSTLAALGIKFYDGWIEESAEVFE